MTGTVRQVGSGFYAVDFDGVAATTGGAIASIPNPWGKSVFVVRSWILFRTASTGAANLTVGVAADGTTEATDIINALAAASTTGKLYNGAAVQTTTKTEVTAPAVWAATSYVTVTGSATTAGMEATLFLEVVPGE